MVKSKVMDFELVAKSDVITLHLRDHGKPANTQGMSAKLTLLNGTEKSEVMLAPAGGSTLEAKGSFKVAVGTKVVEARHDARQEGRKRPFCHQVGSIVVTARGLGRHPALLLDFIREHKTSRSRLAQAAD